MTDPHALPHSPYITAVVDALTAVGMEPDSYWTSDAEIDPYETGPDAGCTTMLSAVIGWDDESDDDSGGLFLFWDHPAGQWQHARPRSQGGNTEPEFLASLPCWVDPAVVVIVARALLSGDPAPTAVGPLWLGCEAAQAAVAAWSVSA